MASFYDLTESEGRILTESALAEGRTLFERWQALDSERTEAWNRRAVTAATWLSEAGATAVLDLGCGKMALERALPPGSRYLPCDVVPRDERTIVCDLNREPAPAVEADAVACLGLLEYLLDPGAVMAQLSMRYSHAAVSYNTCEGQPNRAIRRGHGWFNDLARSELEDLFRTAGWQLSRAEPLDRQQTLWLLTSK